MRNIKNVIFLFFIGLFVALLSLFDGNVLQAKLIGATTESFEKPSASQAIEIDHLSTLGNPGTRSSSLECFNADMNNDSGTNIMDIQMVAMKRGMVLSDSEWNGDFDMNHNEVIDDEDVSMIASKWRTLFLPCIEVELTSPQNLSLFNSSTITVTGIITEAEGVTSSMVVVNDIVASLNEGRFTAQIELEEGSNTITAVAKDGAKNVGTGSIQVTVDTTAPRVVINSPPDGFVSHDEVIHIKGVINDIVVGTVNSEEGQVTVNGVQAEVANRSFLALDVPLTPGENVITAVGTDQVGNMVTTKKTVMYEPILDAPKINIVSGNNQSGQISQPLAQPLVVRLDDADGNPMVNEKIIFKVTENNGQVNDGNQLSRSLVVTTNAQGEAQVSWSLGTRSGAGNNMIEVSAVGFVGRTFFIASGEPGEAARIHLDVGNNQVGLIGEPLPYPFVVVATDEGHNRLTNVPVTFSVLEGGGSFDGQSSITVTSDSDGRAVALLSLGLEVGRDNHVVQATMANNTGLPVSFVASGQMAGNPEKTTISGIVLDNNDIPIEGVTVRLADGSSLSSQSDAQGQFVLENAPIGKQHLIVDGDTAQRPGSWASLEFELVTIAGRDNTIGMPIYLLALDTENELCVSASEGGVLTLPDVPGFSMTVQPGSATFIDGSQEGCISVTPVHIDKMPMAPQFGQQPRLAITIQPHGTVFDPPAAITMPNTDGMAPGEISELYSFDHDLEQFVSIGTGTVNQDGTLMASDPGVGIVKAGWHCGGNPTTTGDVLDAEIELKFDADDDWDDSANPSIKLMAGAELEIWARGIPQPEGNAGVQYIWHCPDPDVIQVISVSDEDDHPNHVRIQAVGEPGDTTTVDVTYTYQATAAMAWQTTKSIQVTIIDPFRTFNGTGNNMDNPTWGSKDTQLLRLSPPAYQDGESEPRGGGLNTPATLSSPRAVSNAVVAQSAPIFNTVEASDFLWQWGQFLDHDIDLTELQEPHEAFQIDVPAGDPSFDPGNTGTVEMDFNRSIFDPATGTTNARQQINEITAWIDASQVYGSDTVRADWKRSFVDGKLAISAGNLLPFEDNAPTQFAAGDIRANEQIGLTAMHTLFMREHNRLADRILADNPTMNDEEIYQRARAIVGAQIQRITYNEFLPLLLGATALPPYNGYDKTVNPGISNEFSTAAFRVGHTMLSPTLLRLDQNGNEIASGHVPLRNAFFNSQWIIDDGIEPILRGLATQRAQEIDTQLIDDVRNFLFGPPGSGGFDLAALNLQRGRDHGLAGYNDVRVAYGLAPLNNFSDITSDANVASGLASVYDSVDDVDLWVGGLAEDHVAGAVVGETFRAIMADQFTRLRDGDCYWHETIDWTTYGFAAAPILHADGTSLFEVTLAQLIRWNTDITNIQDDVFHLP